MKRSVFVKHILIVFLLAISTMVLTSCGKKKDGSYNFYYASYKGAERVESKIYYNDNFFSSPASKYNEELSTASICLALSGFSQASSGNYINSPMNAQDLFNKLGFSNFKSNSDGISKPNAHSFGVYMASKVIDDYTLIGVTVRGAGYLSEWASNVRLGENPKYADGFYEASSIYLESLKTYITENNISGKIKIWTAGYSRGGAGVNLSIGRIDLSLVDGTNILGDNLSFNKDDIYAYCFEAPAGVVYSLNDDGSIYEKGENFSNIHCIVNINDPVPYVGPMEYGFVRFGVDHYLPDILTDINFNKHVEYVKKIMDDIPNSDYFNGYTIDNFKYNGVLSLTKRVNYPMGMYLDSFIKELAKAIGSRSNYSSNYEKQISGLCELVFKNDNTKDSFIDIAISLGKNIILQDSNEILLVDLQHNLKRTWEDFKPLLRKAIKKTGIEGIDIDELFGLMQGVIDAILSMTTSMDALSTIPTLLSMDNVKAFASSHIPEIQLAHMFAIDKNYNNKAIGTLSSSYYKLIVNTSSSFTLYANDKEISKVTQDSYDSKVVLEKLGDSYTYYLPSNATYEIKSLDDVEVSLFVVDSAYITDYLVDNNTAMNVIKGDILW